MTKSKYASDIEEIKTTLAGIAPQVECIPALKEAMSDVRVNMAEVMTKIDLLHESCPFKGDIALAKANHEKLGEVEKRTQRNEVGIAKIGVAAIGGGTVVALIQELLKAIPQVTS